MYYVFRFDYDLKNGEQSWTAFVAATDIKEATKFLEGMANKPGGGYRLKSSGVECRLDAIADSIRNKILEGAGVGERTKGQPQKVAEKAQTVEEPKPPVRKKMGRPPKKVE